MAGFPQPSFAPPPPAPRPDSATPTPPERSSSQQPTQSSSISPSNIALRPSHRRNHSYTQSIPTCKWLLKRFSFAEFASGVEAYQDGNTFAQPLQLRSTTFV